MAGLDILTDATWEPVSLDLAKRQCILDDTFTDDDEYFSTILIPGAREAAELHTNRSYPLRMFREYFDGFPGQHLPIPYNVVFDFPVRHQFTTIPRHRFELSRSPFAAIQQIQYLDQDGATQTLDPSLYYVEAHKEPAAIFRSSPRVQWPIPLHRVDSVWVDYSAGYHQPGQEDDLKPMPVIALQAQLLLIAHFYENRTPVTLAGAPMEIPYTIQTLLDRNRVYYQP